MRTGLDQALDAPPSPGYAANLAQGQPIKAIHIQELRERVLTEWVSASSTDIRWLVTDHLGTPRMIFDQTGSLANMKRHDYLPFGEELFGGPPNQPGVDGRLTTQGYVVDNVRQKFTSKERDSETGLDHFGARYFGSAQGRFTSADPFSIVMLRQNSPNDDKTQAAFMQFLSDPRRWNRFAYTVNSPLVFTDKTGLDIMIIENGPTNKPNDSKSGGNPVGHTAIAISNRGVFSFGNAQGEGSGNNNIIHGGVKDYIKREIGDRNTTVYIIKTTAEQDAAAAESLVMSDIAGGRLQGTSIAGDNCSTRVNLALDAAGIEPSLMPSTIPGSAGNRATNDPGFVGKIEIPQNSNLLGSDLKALKPFEPKSSIPAPGTAGGTPVVPMRPKHEE